MLLEFYKKVLTSIGLHVSDDGFVYIMNDKDKIMLTIDGKPLVLPTKEHINSMLITNEDGEIEVSKILYNPLNENYIKGDSVSLKRTKQYIERQLGKALAMGGTLLLTLAENVALQKKTNSELNKFLSGLNEANNANIKEIVDQKSIDQWLKLYGNMLKTDPGILSIFLKKGGVYDNVKYNRLATIKSPLYEELLTATKETHVQGMKLRPKDLIVYRLLFKFLLPDMDVNNVISIGSNDTNAPGFVSLFTLYLKIAERLNEIMEMLAFVDAEISETGKFDLQVTLDMLSKIDIYKSELNLIPSDIDVNREKVAKTSVTNVLAQQSEAMNRPTVNIPGVSKEALDSVFSKGKEYTEPVARYTEPVREATPMKLTEDTSMDVTERLINQRRANQQQQYPSYGYGNQSVGNYQQNNNNVGDYRSYGNNGGYNQYSNQYNNYQQRQQERPMGVSAVLNQRPGYRF